MLDAGSPMFTTNYVVVEICALAQHRLGIDAVRAIQRDILPVMEVRWIDEGTPGLAMAALLVAGLAFAFDRHFSEEGFLFPE